MNDLTLPPTGEASKTIKLIAEGKMSKLKGLIPKGQSPKIYLDLIKSQVFGLDSRGKPRSDDELLMFLYVSKRTGLDPLTHQIHAVFRWDTRVGKERMTIQTGIDGMRLVAQRTGAYAGQDDVKFLPEDELSPVPVKATVTVYKIINNTRVGFTASARWSEYAQSHNGKLGPMWEKMPYTMLGKCAEALALRKGFPNELSGIYSDEEIMTPATQINIPTPDKFKKEEIKVEHGAPADQAPLVGTVEAAKQPKQPEVVKDGQTPKVEEVRPNMEAIKKNLQERVEQSKKAAQEAAKVEKKPEVKSEKTI